MEALATIRTVSHVAIEVADLATSVAFYRRTLGMTVIGDFSNDPAQPNVKALLGDFAIEIAQSPEQADRSLAADTGHATPSLTLSLTVKDLRSAFARFRASGLVDCAEPKTLGGAWFFTFRDPDGNAIELIEFPKDSSSLGELLITHANRTSRGDQP